MGCCSSKLRERLACVPLDIFMESFCAASALIDFITDILAARSLAHADNTIVHELGYAGAGLLLCTIPSNFLIVKNHRHRFASMYKHAKEASPLLTDVFLCLSLTNCEIMTCYLALATHHLDKEDLSEASRAKRDLHKCGIISQLVEDIPQLTIQISASVLLSLSKKNNGPIVLISIGCAVATLIFKFIMNQVVQALDLDASQSTIRHLANVERLDLSFKSSASVILILHITALVMSVIFLICLSSVTRPLIVVGVVQLTYQAVGCAVMVVASIIAWWRAIRFLKHHRDQFWHCLLELRISTCVVLLSAIHPILLCMLQQQMQQAVLSHASLQVAPLLRYLCLGLLALWCVWKEGFPVDERFCIAVVVINGISFMHTLFYLNDVDQHEYKVHLDSQPTAQQVEEYDLDRVQRAINEFQEVISKTSGELLCSTEVCKQLSFLGQVLSDQEVTEIRAFAAAIDQGDCDALKLCVYKSNSGQMRNLHELVRKGESAIQLMPQLEQAKAKGTFEDMHEIVVQAKRAGVAAIPVEDMVQKLLTWRLEPVPGTPDVGFKVCLCGSSGACGQPLSMLLAMNPYVQFLSLYDVASKSVVPPTGHALDLHHIQRRCKVRGFEVDPERRPIDQDVKECFAGCSLVLILAGKQQQGARQQDSESNRNLLLANAEIAKGIMEVCARWCPNAIVGLTSPPLNALLPAMAELREKNGLDPRKVVGITTVNVAMINKIVHEMTQSPIELINVPVVGGCDGATVVPLFSQYPITRNLDLRQKEALTARLQTMRQKIKDSKVGEGDASLQLAYAVARFTKAVLKGLTGTPTEEFVYARADEHPLKYFSSKVRFNIHGVERVAGFSDLDEWEQQKMKVAEDLLQQDILEGKRYASTAEFYMKVSPMREESLTHQKPRNEGRRIYSLSPVPLTPAKQFKVCICGAAGHIGQPLSLLVAMDSRVGELSLLDVSSATLPTGGIAEDLSLLERRCKVTAYELKPGQRPIEHSGSQRCFSGCDLVLMVAGKPREVGQEKLDLLKTNAAIVKGLVEACAHFCPKAIVAISTNPVNCLVPAMASLYEKHGLSPMQIVGITTVDVVRANKFLHERTGQPIEDLNVPVVGGHDGLAIVPLFSKDPVGACQSEHVQEELDQLVQDAGTAVLRAKDGRGSASLAAAYAFCVFTKDVLHALSGHPTRFCAYVKSDVCPPLTFFASEVQFGVNGVETVFPLPLLSAREQRRLSEAKKKLESEISEGLRWAEGTQLWTSDKNNVLVIS